MKLEKYGKTVEINSDYPDEFMKPYIETLAAWAGESWDYDAVENWIPSEWGGQGGNDMYLIVHSQEGYFKVHYPDIDDFEGLFSQKYSDAPGPLEGWDGENIHMEVYWKISKDEYDQLKEKYDLSISQ